jgi:hypothetical protein
MKPIKEIPIEDFIDLNKNTREMSLCDVCKSYNKVPCDHKIAIFRSRDRIDDIVDALNEIICFLNNK